MPRIQRIKSESNIYHVITRGNERKSLFIDDEDRQRFVDIETVLGIFPDSRHKAKELFEKFSQEKNEDIFIEYNDDSNEENELKSRKEIESYIEK